MASNNKKEEPNTAPQPDRWFNLTLGSSFKDHYPSSKFCTLRRITAQEQGKQSSCRISQQPTRKPKVTFEGDGEDYKENDALLFFDGESFWLEVAPKAISG
ncbi:hypothetical protein LOK49_LG11G02062 [Camellia lanceoleosa]|uniref:Uncharacterized protein n=1 Tax=Camellia lanceoleosa TaxID=1840588 RepID=A0ACC0G5X9_9ERIC|nr:hypothetical protein LOK49_LG11G02062 [Camellia lanceoleosa]